MMAGLDVQKPKVEYSSQLWLAPSSAAATTETTEMTLSATQDVAKERWWANRRARGGVVGDVAAKAENLAHAGCVKLISTIAIALCLRLLKARKVQPRTRWES
mmetsp:Transcript_108944/g.222396  ORF Transcript_108944/g.222396 Transcript_108944/m.222396 type:complete len:103 (+) Transcript_108944:804-1112(+)